jgi:hypothetical protein
MTGVLAVRPQKDISTMIAILISHTLQGNEAYRATASTAVLGRALLALLPAALPEEFGELCTAVGSLPSLPASVHTELVTTGVLPPLLHRLSHAGPNEFRGLSFALSLIFDQTPPYDPTESPPCRDFETFVASNGLEILLRGFRQYHNFLLLSETVMRCVSCVYRGRPLPKEAHVIIQEIEDLFAPNSNTDQRVGALVALCYVAENPGSSLILSLSLTPLTLCFPENHHLFTASLLTSTLTRSLADEFISVRLHAMMLAVALIRCTSATLRTAVRECFSPTILANLEIGTDDTKETESRALLDEIVATLNL